MNRYPRIFFLFLIVLLVAACSTTASRPQGPAIERIETTDLNTVLAITANLKLAAKDVLVVFDIDNTLLAMQTDLGSDQWYDWQKRLQEQDPCHPDLVADRLAVQGALFFAGSMRPTQPDAASIVRKLQTSGYRVMAETARGWTFALSTFRELRRQGIDFRASAPGLDGGYGEFQPPGVKRPLLYRDGVYMLAGQHKGEMLRLLLEKSGETTPRAIIVIDDKAYNLDAYEETARQQGWRLYSLYYTGVADWVEHFDPRQATRQWQELRPALLRLQQWSPGHYRIPPRSVPAECSER